MSHKPRPNPEDMPWELNPANPKVQEALGTTFEFPITGLEIQMLGASCEQMKQFLMADIQSGCRLSGAGPEMVPAAVQGMMQLEKMCDRLEARWKDAVLGMSVGDLPPDPFL
jgi:hypothetical protein